MRVEERESMKTIFIENEKERDAFMAAPDSAVIWNDGMTPVLKRDIERVTLPRELLEEPPYSRAEKLITEMYEGQQALAPETKLDVVAQAVRQRAGDGGIASAYYDREKAELHVSYTNGTIESILIEPPERQLQNMIQGREPVSARMAEKIEIPALRVLPETFTVDVLIDRPSSLEGDWVSVRRTDTCLRNADGTWSVSVGIERDSSQELAILEQQFRHSVFEAERLEKKRREELEKELTDINKGREDDGYIPGVYEPEYGH